jgi:hypothetical protein
MLSLWQREENVMKPKTLLVFCMFSALTGACASYPPPTAKVASSESAIRAARELNADGVPAAQLHMKLAQDQVNQAKKLVAQDENQRAEYLLIRAEADAELAVVLAKQEQTHKQAEASKGKLQELSKKGGF